MEGLEAITAKSSSKSNLLRAQELTLQSGLGPAKDMTLYVDISYSEDSSGVPDITILSLFLQL